MCCIGQQSFLQFQETKYQLAFINIFDWKHFMSQYELQAQSKELQQRQTRQLDKLINNRQSVSNTFF